MDIPWNVTLVFRTKITSCLYNRVMFRKTKIYSFHLALGTNNFHTWAWQRWIIHEVRIVDDFTFTALWQGWRRGMWGWWRHSRETLKSLHWHLVLWLPHLMPFCSRLSRGYRSIWSKYIGSIDQPGRLRRSPGPNGINPRVLNMKFLNFWLRDVKCHYKWTLS